MKIEKYFENINNESQNVFSESKQRQNELGTLHHLSSCIHEFSSSILDRDERTVLEAVSIQLESANFSLTLGLYRQAFSSLRLALELGLAAIYFSAHRIELNEWLDGRLDIKWSVLTDRENGVLSKRFSQAFFKELTDEIEHYRGQSTSVYRKLSEYVHGNSETWEKGIKLAYDAEIFDTYLDYYKSSVEVILFACVCRYTTSLEESSRESMQFVTEELGHLEEIRKAFGRS